jgi:hypothetical protein
VLGDDVISATVATPVGGRKKTMRRDKSRLRSPLRAADVALEGISARYVETRIGPLKQALGLHDPGFRFVFAAEARDRPGLAACRRHLDSEGDVALRRYLECRDCHSRQYAATIPQRNLFIPTALHKAGRNM